MATPSLSSVSPTSYTANNTGQTMELFGSNFVSGDTLTFVDPQNDVYANEVTTYVSSGELETTFNNGDDPGTWKVEVNSSGGSSSYVFFTVAAAVATPSLSSVSPTSYTANNTGQTMELFGSNFVSGDTLTFVDPQNDVYANEVTTYVSSGALETTFNNGDDPGTWKVEVNSSGGSSSYVFFTVAAAVATPSLSSVSPTSYTANNTGQTMELFGSNFVSGDTLTFVDPQNDVYANEVTTYVSSGELETTFNNGDDPGTWKVEVNSSGGSSSYVFFTVAAAVATPSLSSVSPTSYTANNSGQTMELFGSNFVSGDTLTFVDPQNQVFANEVTTYVSGSELEATFNNGDDPGTWKVEVNSSSGSSSYVSFTVAGVSSAVDPFISYADATPNQPTAADVVGAAEKYIGATWEADNCTGLVWAVSEAIGAPFYETIETVTNGQATSASELAVVPDNDYIVPPSQPEAGSSSDWTTFFSSDWTAQVQVGDLVRIPGTVNLGATDPNSGHSFIVVGNSDTANTSDPNTWLVIDNTVQNPSGSTVQISIPHTFDNLGNTFDMDVLSASSAYVSYLTTPASASPSLSSVSPTSYAANSNGQTMELLGSNFVSGDTLTFVDPQNQVYANEATTYVSSGELEATFNNGDDPGTWTVQVNSSSGNSSTVSFTVTGGGGGFEQGIDYRYVYPSDPLSASDIEKAEGGKQFAIEYIGSTNSDGYLRPADVTLLEQANLGIVSVFEKAQMSDTANGSYTNAWVNYFDNGGALGQGTADAKDAIKAAEAAGQTSGAIYFAIDLDPGSNLSGISEASAVSEIDEYFQEIETYFTQSGAPYDIGVYGAGDTLNSVKDVKHLAKFSWLAEATGWTGSGTYTDWNIKQSVDSNLYNPNTGIKNAAVFSSSTAAELQSISYIASDQTSSATFGSWGITAPAQPDLTETVVLGSTTVAAGASITVTAYDVNIGAGAAPGSTAGIYLSTDATITTSDTLLTTVTSPGLASGKYDVQNVSVTLPGNLAPGTYYIGGIADYSNQVSESNETNNTYNVVKITIAAPAASVSAGSISVGAGKSVAIASDLTLSNPNSDAISYYAFFDSGVGGGYFTSGSTVEAAGQWFYVTPGNLGSVSYVGGSAAGSETLFTAVYDGSAGAWSSNAAFTATTTAPVVAGIGVGNISVGAGKSVSIASDLTLSNPNSDAIPYYAFFDSGVGGGHFTVGGSIESAGQWFYVTPGNLGSVSYVGGSAAGSETLFAAVYDSTAGAWSSYAPFTATTTAPVVAGIGAGNISVGPGQSVTIAPDLTLSNPNNDAIAYYAFFDSGVGGGHFTLGGSIESAGQWFYVAPGNLGSVSYVGGSAAGSETLFAAVYDSTAGAWSSYAAFSGTTTAPVVAGIGAWNFSVGVGDPVSVASDLTLSNPNSDAISYYGFFDSGAGGGHFTVGSTVEAAGQWFYVTPANLNSVSYVGGSTPGSETLFAAVYDGTAGAWSSYASFSATTATTITLNDAAMFSAGAVSTVNTFTGNGGTVTYYGPVTFDGFTLTNLDRTDFALESINAGFAAANGYFFDGLQALEVPAGGSIATADTIQIQQQNGGLFSVNSIELDSLSASTGQSVTFTGVKADNTTVTQTFNLDSVQGFQTFQFASSFTGIKDLDLAPSGNVYFDNIVLAPSASGGSTQTANSGQSDGVAQITVANGATSEISSAFSGNVTFAGSTGTLELDNSSNFHGTVAGLAGQDTLDLRDINPAAVGTPTFAGSWSGGTLTVADGLHSANLALLGNYIGSTFVASSDGHGGTNIIDMAATAQGTPLVVSQHG